MKLPCCRSKAGRRRRGRGSGRWKGKKTKRKCYDSRRSAAWADAASQCPSDLRYCSVTAWRQQQQQQQHFLGAAEMLNQKVNSHSGVLFGGGGHGACLSLLLTVRLSQCSFLRFFFCVALFFKCPQCCLFFTVHFAFYAVSLFCYCGVIENKWLESGWRGRNMKKEEKKHTHKK